MPGRLSVRLSFDVSPFSPPRRQAKSDNSSRLSVSGCPVRIDHRPANGISVPEAAKRLSCSEVHVRVLLRSDHESLAGWQQPNQRWVVDADTLTPYLAGGALRSQTPQTDPPPTESSPRPGPGVPDNVHDLLLLSAEQRAVTAETLARAEQSEHRNTQLQLDAALRKIAALEAELARVTAEHIQVLDMAVALNDETGRSLRMLRQRAGLDDEQ
jgi:hypothetical protein